MNININDVLKVLLSDLRIMQTNFCKSSYINSGEIISLGIAPLNYQNIGLLDEFYVSLKGLSEIQGNVPVIQGIPLSLEISWEVKDENGDPAIEGIDYLAPNGLNCISASLVFIPKCFTELTSDPIASLNTHAYAKRYDIVANVTMKVGPAYQEPLKLNPITLYVLPLSLPKVFTVFSNKHFAEIGMHADDSLEHGGEALIMVPLNSPLRSKKDLLNNISELKSQIATLSSLLDFSLLGLGLNLLENALNSHSLTYFRIGSKFNLEKIRYEPSNSGWCDVINSFIFMGPPGSAVKCYAIDNEDSPLGMFSLQTDSQSSTCYALARDLQSKKPVTEPRNTELVVNSEPEDYETFAQYLDVVEFETPNNTYKCF